MGLGLQWANANSDMAANVRQRIMDQIAAEQRAKADAQQQVENSLRERQFQSGEELKKAQLQALTENRTAQADERQLQGDIRLGDTIPAGQLPPDAPAPLIGRLQRIGQIDTAPQRPAVDVGPLLPGDTGMARGVLKLASQSQQKTQEEADAKVEAARLAAENRTNDNEQRGKDRLAQIAAAAAAKPAKDTTVSDNARIDRSYQFNSSQLKDVSKPLADKQANLSKAADALAERTPAADAIVVPTILTAMAGGAGSGLRMNEAEIARIFGGRSGWESIKAAINKWNPNSGNALQITDAQRAQLGKLLETAHGKVSAKLQVVRKAAQDLVNAGDVDEHRRIVTDAQSQIDSLDSGGGAAKTTTRYDLNGNPIK